MAVETLKSFLTNGFDFVAFGEVCEADVNKIRSAIAMGFEGYDLCDYSNKVGKTNFDVMVAYNSEALSIVSSVDLSANIDGSTYKLGQHFCIYHFNSDKIFDVIVSHWPCRLNPEIEIDHTTIAMHLRNKVDSIIDSDKDAHIVLMGDYNCEPFEYSISEYLRATRDKSVVANKRRLLFNPFWRHLYETNSAVVCNPGTYYHEGGKRTKWRTFDQMMFSAPFVDGANGWVLDESVTCVFCSDELFNIVVAREKIFDHLPIVAVINEVVK